MEGTYDKLRELRALMAANPEMFPDGQYPRVEVDGGVNLSNVAGLLEAGADTIVTGSAVFRGDIEANTKQFMAILSGK